MALGHAELIEQAAAGQVADDARVVVSELGRLRRQAGRMLLLASADDPGFLELAPFPVDTLVMDALERWGYTPRRWRLGEVAEASVTGDRERIAVALDALLENAIAHTGPEDLIELSARLADGQAVFAVTDAGCGIPADDLERVFDRFSRGQHPDRNRESSGLGLGLPTVRAIAEAHHGSIRVRSTVGIGSTFELPVPVTPTATLTVGPGVASVRE